jgi:hypothetical protein
LPFITTNNISYKPLEEKNPEQPTWRMRGSGNGHPTSYPMVRKLPVQKDKNMMGDVG